MRRFLLAITALSLTASTCKEPEKEKPTPDKAPVEKVEKTPEPPKATPQPTKPDELPEGTDEQRKLLVQAKKALMSEDWDGADAVFQKLIETDEMSGLKITGYIALAQSYRDQDEPEKAIELLDKLKEIEFAEVQFVLARSFADAGETTKSMRAYERTIKIQNDYLQAYVELAGLYAKSGRKEESEKMFYEYEKKVYAYAKKLESLDTPPEERLHALDVFTFVNDDRANQAIVRALKDPEWRIRAQAIDLIRELKLGAAAEQIADMEKNDPNLEVRMMAKDAIKTLGAAPKDGAKPTFQK